jgi:hypothetical protein
MTSFDRPWIDWAPATHPLVNQLAGRTAELTIGGDPEVTRAAGGLGHGVQAVSSPRSSSPRRSR